MCTTVAIKLPSGYVIARNQRVMAMCLGVDLVQLDPSYPSCPDACLCGCDMTATAAAAHMLITASQGGWAHLVMERAPCN